MRLPRILERGRESGREGLQSEFAVHMHMSIECRYEDCELHSYCPNLLNQQNNFNSLYSCAEIKRVYDCLVPVLHNSVVHMYILWCVCTYLCIHLSIKMLL